MCNCKYCGKEFNNYRQIISHRRHCKNNPNYEKNLELTRCAAKRSAIVIKQKAENDPLNKIIEYQFTCIKCGKQYTLFLKERDYLKGNYRKTCSDFCANSHIGLTKGKTKICKCIKCGNNFEVSIHRTNENFICNDCKIDKRKLSRTQNILARLTGVNKKICKECCVLIKNKCSDNCYFYKNDICNKSTNSLSQKLNTLIKYFDFNINNCLNENDAIKEYNRIKNIIQMDIDNGLSANEICKKYTGSYKKGNTVFKILNIHTRNLKDAIKNAVLMGKSIGYPEEYKFKTEHHDSWNNKQFYLRSSYETDYANELDKKKIDYEVENLRIKYFDTQKKEYRCAIPDFYLPKSNTIVEIKSLYTLNIQEMKDKVKAYKNLGYNFKLILEHKEEELDNIEKIENNKIIYIKQ